MSTADALVTASKLRNDNIHDDVITDDDDDDDDGDIDDNIEAHELSTNDNDDDSNQEESVSDNDNTTSAINPLDVSPTVDVTGGGGRQYRWCRQR